MMARVGLEVTRLEMDDCTVTQIKGRRRMLGIGSEDDLIIICRLSEYCPQMVSIWLEYGLQVGLNMIARLSEYG